MSQIALQPVSMPQVRYYKPPKTETEKVPINGAKILTERGNGEGTERREKLLKSIAVLTQYMEDLKAGRPVENLSPSNDPYYLVPENIASIIRGEEDILAGRVIRINSIKDIIGEWDT